MQSDEYRRAQLAIAELKAAIVALLERMPEGATNSTIGRSLGIYSGHSGHKEHEGHITRTMLAMLELEGVVQQTAKDKTWSLRRHPNH